jgi:lysophospholipase L1-like esterase
MKRIVSIILLIFISTASNSQLILGAFKEPPNNDTIVFLGKDLPIVGNSITNSYGISDPDDGYAPLYCAAKGATFLNYGINGQVLQHGTSGCATEFDQTTVPDFDASIAGIVIALGVNDTGINNGVMTPAAFKTALKSFINYLVSTKSYTRKKIIVFTPFYTTQAGRNLYVSGGCPGVTAADETRALAYVTAALEAAAEEGTQIVDVYHYFEDNGNPATMLLDGVHPNETGHALYANYLIPLKFYL